LILQISAVKAFEKINISNSEISEKIDDIYTEILDIDSSIWEIKVVSDNIAIYQGLMQVGGC
jgi:hypothetical protein